MKKMYIMMIAGLLFGKVVVAQSSTDSLSRGKDIVGPLYTAGEGVSDSDVNSYMSTPKKAVGNTSSLSIIHGAVSNKKALYDNLQNIVLYRTIEVPRRLNWVDGVRIAAYIIITLMFLFIFGVWNSKVWWAPILASAFVGILASVFTYCTDGWYAPRLTWDEAIFPFVVCVLISSVGKAIDYMVSKRRPHIFPVH
jgi:hypothetical protein